MTRCRTGRNGTLRGRILTHEELHGSVVVLKVDEAANVSNGAGLDSLELPLEPVRVHEIIIIDDGSVEASAFLGCKVSCSRNALILLPIVLNPGVVKFVYDLLRVVRAAIVDDYDFEILHRLVKYRENRFSQEICAVVCGNGH